MRDSLPGWALFGILLTGLSARPASAQFTPGTVVVERIGTGTGALSNAATPVFIEQYLPGMAGQSTPNFTLPLPTAPSGSNLRLTESGTATASGYFNRTTDGLALVVPGYNADPGTAAVASSDPATVNRTIGLVTAAGSVNVTNGFADGGASSFRSVISRNGSEFWFTTTGSARYTPNTGTVAATTTELATGTLRTVNMFNNSLFIASSSAALSGVSLVGNVGSPPTSAGVTVTNLPGTGTSGAGGQSSPYGFALFDNPNNPNDWNGTGLDTLFVADDRSAANGGGIQRWDWNGGTNWTLVQTITSPTNTGFRGLAAELSGNTVTLYATTTQTNANSLIQVTNDLTLTANSFGTPMTLATAAANTVFRGVALSPVPEPAHLLLLCGVAAGAGRWLRRRSPAIA